MHRVPDASAGSTKKTAAESGWAGRKVMEYFKEFFPEITNVHLGRLGNIPELPAGQTEGDLWTWSAYLLDQGKVKWTRP